MAIINFDANEFEPYSDFATLPIGEYIAVIAASEMKETKSGSGQYLELVFDIIEGEHTGRKLWERLNLVNTNVMTQEIAQKTLSSICRAINVMNPKMSEELHDIPVCVKVGIQPAKDGYDERNVIKGYKPATTTDPASTTADPAPPNAPWDPIYKKE